MIRNWRSAIDCSPSVLRGHLFLKRPLLGLNEDYEDCHDFAVSTGNPSGGLLGWGPIRSDVGIRPNLIGYNLSGPELQIWIMPQSDWPKANKSDRRFWVLAFWLNVFASIFWKKATISVVIHYVSLHVTLSLWRTFSVALFACLWEGLLLQLAAGLNFVYSGSHD